METVQIVIDHDLLKAADRAARRARQNRSELVREAIREHLRRLEIRALEEREREAYRKQPQTSEEIELWEKAASWPAQ